MEQPTFRTVIEHPRASCAITHGMPLLSLGSCFAEAIGSRLQQDGFDISVNPTGVLYNPVSLANVVTRATAGILFNEYDLTQVNGTFHCLDFPSVYQSTDSAKLLETVNHDFSTLVSHLRQCEYLLVTFGTAWIFNWNQTGKVVGNCHKIDSRCFTRTRIDVKSIVKLWLPILEQKKIIFTVSPIRHLADGLHGNQLSKATLLLAIDELCTKSCNAQYFPAYEALLDDLRDYRFYNADMKHPSPIAQDYIYRLFSETYMSPATRTLSREHHALWLRSQHREIINREPKN